MCLETSLEKSQCLSTKKQLRLRLQHVLILQGNINIHKLSTIFPSGPFHFLAVSLVHVQFWGPLTDQIPSISAVRRRRPQCWWGRVQIPSQPRFLESKWKLETAGTAPGFTKVENWQFRFGDSAKLSKHGLSKLKIPNSQHIVQSSHIQQLMHSLHTILSSLAD